MREINNSDVIFINKVSNNFKNIGAKYVLDLASGLCVPLVKQPKVIGRSIGILNRKSIDRLRLIFDEEYKSEALLIVDAAELYRLFYKDKKKVTFNIDDEYVICHHSDTGRATPIVFSSGLIEDVFMEHMGVDMVEFYDLISELHPHQLSPEDVNVICLDCLNIELDGLKFRFTKQHFADVKASSSISVRHKPLEYPGLSMSLTCDYKEFMDVYYKNTVVAF